MADSNTPVEIGIKTEFEQMQNALQKAIQEMKSMGYEIQKVQAITKNGDINKTIINAQNGLKKIRREIDITGKVLKETSTQGTGLGLTKSFGANLGKFYALWNVTKRVRDSIGGWFKSAVDFNETVNKFNVSMGKSANQATRFQNKLSEAFGTAKEEMMNYQSTFKNILGGLGKMSSDTSEKISESLVKMGLDYSSLFNVNQEETMKKFQSALTGSIMPIRRDSGYDVSKNAVIGKAQELGIDRNYNKLNETEKRLIRILLLMDQLKNTGAFNDMARTIRKKIVAKIRNYFRNKLCEHKQKWCENNNSFMQEMAY